MLMLIFTLVSVSYASHVIHGNPVFDVISVNKVMLTRLNTSAKANGYGNFLATVNSYHGKYILSPLSNLLRVVKDNDYDLNKALNRPLAFTPDYDHYFTLAQITDKYLVYTYYNQNSSNNWIIFVEKPKGQLFIQGQQMTKGFYVYLGNLSYSNALNSENTAPLFRHVDLGVKLEQGKSPDDITK
jgi:hypothetical protein